MLHKSRISAHRIMQCMMQCITMNRMFDLDDQTSDIPFALSGPSAGCSSIIPYKDCPCKVFAGLCALVRFNHGGSSVTSNREYIIV